MSSDGDGSSGDATGVDSDGSDGSDGDTGADDTGGAVCGNGVVDPGETCDAQGESPQCDADCTEVACGDATVNVAAGEECEGDELAGATCEGLGFDGGVLSCEAGCTYDTSGCTALPEIPQMQLEIASIKVFGFDWASVAGADYYQLLESRWPGDPFVQVGEDVTGESLSIEVPLHHRAEASYVLRACNDAGCTDSAPVPVTGTLDEAIGYFKAANPGSSAQFGIELDLSAEGGLLAVGAHWEDSMATGIDGDQTDESASSSGAVFVFGHDGLGAWSQHAYVKASNTDAGDNFGRSVAISADGNTLAVGATGERSNAAGVDGDQANDAMNNAGAVYVFARDGGGGWSQQAYVKASNTGAEDYFGNSVALSADGSTLAVGAPNEDSSAEGIDGDQADAAAEESGAVYVFTRDGGGGWSQQAYVKASNPGADDRFGVSLGLSGDGDTLAVGAYGEDSSAVGIDGDQADDSMSDAGAAYVFVRDGGGGWSQQAYVKASNTGIFDRFGNSLSLSDDGSTLAVGAVSERSGATGIDGDQTDDRATGAGAVYVFMRDGMGAWSQHAYVKASNTGAVDAFGNAVALSGDGHHLAVSARLEDSEATGVGGAQEGGITNSGAVYAFVLGDDGAWTQRGYVKAINTGSYDAFGDGLALSEGGETLAVSAPSEQSAATGIGGDPFPDDAFAAGAAYVY